RMARELRRAADEPVAAHHALVRMIRSWEDRKHKVSERYLLLYEQVFGAEWPLNGTRPDPAAVLERARASPGPAEITAIEETVLAAGASPDAAAALFAGIRDLERQLAALRELAERLFGEARDE